MSNLIKLFIKKILVIYELTKKKQKEVELYPKIYILL